VSSINEFLGRSSINEILTIFAHPTFAGRPSASIVCSVVHPGVRGILEPAAELTFSPYDRGP